VLTLVHSLDVLEETSKIVFNAADLELDQVSLHSEALKTEQVQVPRSYLKSLFLLTYRHTDRRYDS
jgi:hypothetical protein